MEKEGNDQNQFDEFRFTFTIIPSYLDILQDLDLLFRDLGISLLDLV